MYVPGKTNTSPDALLQPPGADRGEIDNKNIIILPKHKFIATTTTMEDGKIIVSLITQVKRGILNLTHDYSTAGHPSRDKML
jgi:hypothetical protein